MYLYFILRLFPILSLQSELLCIINAGLLEFYLRHLGFVSLLVSFIDKDLIRYWVYELLMFMKLV